MYLKSDFKSSFRILKGGKISLVVSAILGSVIVANASPSGGTITSGDASINQSGNTTNINQSSQKASINWKDFSIKSNETVNFNQPNSKAITLNRVVGNEKSIIDGVLNANDGQVWLLNSNGTLFGKNAKVNTSGLLVTTKNLSDEDFQKGNYNFKGDSTATIENLGVINSEKYSSFVANAVINNGTVKVYSGNINLIGANEFSITLDENSNISLKVTKGVVDALVENNNILIANGGNVYLTTNAKDELLRGVVNNSGIIEANSLEDITGKQSEVIIYAHGGTANIDGTINAKNSFVETSGDKVKIKDNFKVTADTWLIDPTDFTIAASGGDMSGTTLSNNLATADVYVLSTLGSQEGNGNIYVNDTISWSSAKTLTLNAQNNIYINKSITSINDNGKLALKYGQSSANGGSSDYFVNAKVNLKAGDNFSTQKGSNVGNLKNYKVITALGSAGSATGTDLQGINGNLGGNYVLGDDIDASATSSWSNGFVSIGDYSNSFQGSFDGLGHTISNLYINRPSQDNIGLFGYAYRATIQNIGLTAVNINGGNYVGGLVGYNASYGTIKNSYTTGNVNGSINSTEQDRKGIGGLVGNNDGTVENSYSTVSVTGTGNGALGGLVGVNHNNGVITNSYSSGTVSGSGTYIGGLVGRNYINGERNNSFYDNQANVGAMVDSGTYGKTKAEILDLFKRQDRWITGVESFEGYGLGVTAPTLPELKTFSNITPTGKLFYGGYGTADNPYTITNWTQLQNINNNSDVFQGGKFFNLVNNLSSSTSDYTTYNSGTGWNPIGVDYTNRFIGVFDGRGFTISDLYINRTSDNQGLFGLTDSATTIRNIGLLNVNISGYNNLGGVVGINRGKIENSYTTGTINGIGRLGGLVGMNYETNAIIENSYSKADIIGSEIVGGLIGYNYTNASIKNSYASGTVIGGDVGGLVGRNENSLIQNSFYDNTKYTGNGVGSGTTTGVTGLTTQQMSYGGIFKNATWNIVADSSVTSLTPILKYNSATNTVYWAIAPITLNYSLGNQSTTYNGTTQNLSSIYTSPFVIPTDYEFLTVNYKFQKDGSDVSGYKNANIYSNIKVVLDGTSASDEFLAIKNSGNTDGTLTINKKDLIVDVTSNSKVYNGLVQDFDYGITGLVGDDTVSNLALTGVQTSSKNVGIYNSNLTGTNANYNITINQGDLEITKAKLDILANSGSFVYNGQTQSVAGYTFGANKLLGSDTIADINLLNTTTIGKNAGKYNTNMSGTADNYDINITQGELEITKANLSVKADDKSKYK